jgi:hypothetical protein
MLSHAVDVHSTPLLAAVLECTASLSLPGGSGAVSTSICGSSIYSIGEF